jgi:hypothetical protein
MATVQYGVSNGDRQEQVTEATGGSAPTETVEVNIKTGQRKEQVILALDLIRNAVMQSKVFVQ